MEKKHDFGHRFVHRGEVGECRVRVYEELGERPVIVATQGFGPWGHPEPLLMTDGAKTIAADLIAEGIVPGSYRATTNEMLEKIMQTGDATPLRNSAPFWFVVESLQPRHRLYYL